MEGYVTEIQRFSVHDGPGIRTTVFLKGCNMHCIWCHNPETLNPGPELQLFPEKCIGCGECFKCCPRQAHLVIAGERKLRRELCESCGKCAGGCYADALVMVGRKMSPAQVLDEAMEDKEFYASSGGGVTVSGGEPVYQADFSHEILRLCKEKGIHTAIESNMAWPWEKVAPLLQVTDLVMMDMKVLDDQMNKRVTGISNRAVLDNAKKLSRQSLPMIIRTPIIPGVNDTVQAIAAIAEFIAGFTHLLYYELLPYHPLATGKYHSLGMKYGMEGVKRPERALMDELAAAARSRGVTVRCTGA